MFDELSQDIKRAAGPMDTSASFDPTWLRANQMQRRRAAFFSLAAASVSIVAVMGVGAIRSVEPPTADPVAFPSESLGTRMVTVPDVVGMRTTQARKVLRAVGLRMESHRTIECNPYTVHTTGNAGKKGRGVTIDVEQIGGKTKDRDGQHTVFCIVLEPVQIETQSPAAGSEAEVGSMVELGFSEKRSRITGKAGASDEGG